MAGNRLARASVLQFSVQGLQTVLGFLATLYFANVLGADPLGRYFLVLAVVNWLLIPSVGVRSATIKRVSEGRDPSSYFSAGILVQFALVVALIVLVVLTSGSIDAYVGFRAAGFVAALLALNATGTFVLAALRGEEKVMVAGLFEGGWHIFRVLVQVGLVLIGAGVLGLLTGEIASAALAVAAGVLLLDSRFVVPSREHFVRLYEYGKYAWLSSVKTMSYSWMDTIVLGFFVAASTVGVYEIAWRISALFILLPTAITKVVFPRMSKHASKGQTGHLEDVLSDSLIFAGLIAIPGFVGAIIVGTDVLRLYGSEFAAGSLLLVVLCAARIAQSYEVVLLQTLNALDLPEVTFRISFLFTVVNLGLNVTLIWQFGPIGAAVATAVSVAISGVLGLRELSNHVRVRVAVRPILTQLGSATFMGLVILAIQQRFGSWTTVELFAVVLFGTGVYGVVVLLVSPQTKATLRRVVDSSAG